MKLVDIDKCDRELFYKELGTKDGKDVCIFAEDAFNMLEALPPVKAIPIPEGMTNGDMIKYLFGWIKSETDYKNKAGSIILRDGTPMQWNLDWWEAPFSFNHVESIMDKMEKEFGENWDVPKE